MNTRQPKHAVCEHVDQLPRMPDASELPAMRKGLRKIKPPSINAGDEGGHAQLGWFSVEFREDFYLEWHLPGKTAKRYKFSDLDQRPDLEFERLELGWLIGNIYTLNRIHDVERLGAPSGESGLREYARITNWYDKRSQAWYRWAISRSVGN